MTTYEYLIPTWAITAMVNSDESGLSESDSNDLENFSAMLNDKGYYAVPCDWERSNNFCFSNDMTSKGDDCAIATFQKINEAH